MIDCTCLLGFIVIEMYSLAGLGRAHRFPFASALGCTISSNILFIYSFIFFVINELFVLHYRFQNDA